MNNIWNFLEAITAFHVDVVLSAAGVVIFLVGAVLLYKKGLWPGLPIASLAILLVILAALARLFSS